MLIDEEGKPLTKNSLVTPFLSNIGFGQTDNNVPSGYIPTQATVNVEYLTDYSETTLSFTAPVDRLIQALDKPYESHENASDYAFVAETDKEKWYTLVPYPMTVPYHLTLDYRGDYREAVVPIEYLNWQPGYRYTYVFKVGYEGQVNYAPELYTYTKWEAGYSSETTW